MNITRGIIPTARKCVIYGQAGVGKSTLAAGLPSPLIIDAEGGTNLLDVDRVAVHSADEIMDALASLGADSRGYKTIIIDTIDSVECMLINAMIKRDATKDARIVDIESYGYGKGYVLAANEMSLFLARLSELVRAGLNVVLIGHSQITKFEMPGQLAAWDRYSLRLSKKCSSLITDWADELYFLNFATSIASDPVTKKKIGVGGKERILYTEHCDSWDAKSRCGIEDGILAHPDNLKEVFSVAKPVQNVEQQSKKELHEVLGVTDEQLKMYVKIKHGWELNEISDLVRSRMIANPEGARKAILSTTNQ